jgi:hypothetical protein
MSLTTRWSASTAEGLTRIRLNYFHCQVLIPALLWGRVPKLFMAVATLYGVLDRRGSPPGSSAPLNDHCARFTNELVPLLRRHQLCDARRKRGIDCTSRSARSIYTPPPKRHTPSRCRQRGNRPWTPSIKVPFGERGAMGARIMRALLLEVLTLVRNKRILIP